MNCNNNIIDRKKHYVQPDCKVVLLDLESCMEAHVSGVNLNGFNEGEVPTITIDNNNDDDEPNAKQNGMWSDDDAI